MGYELEQLMRQYGVTAPTLAYGGMQAPIKPEEDMVVYRDGATTAPAQTSLADVLRSGRFSGLVSRIAQPAQGTAPSDRIPFAELMEKYNADLVNYQQSQDAFKNYQQQYQNRLASIPMYAAAQLQRDGRALTAPAQLATPVYATPTMPDLANVKREADLVKKTTTSASYGNGGGGGGYDFGGGFSALGGAPDTGTMGGGGYGTDSDGMGGGFGGDSSDGGDGSGWKCGGLVKKYAEGGEVEADPMGGPNQGPRPLPQLSGGRNITPALAELIRQDAYSQGIENPVANFVGPRGTRFGLSPETPTPVPGAQAAGPVMNEGLLQLLDRYGQQTSPYDAELKAARARSEKETEAFTQLIEKMAGAPEAEPSKAEMYFRLAAAFGSPTKTGAFMENAAMASKEMADYQRDRSSRASESKKMQAQLMLEAQKARSQAARDEFTNLRQLAGEDTRSRTAFTRDLVKEYIASGKPQSEAGKAALDAGLQKGTPEFTQFVNNYVTKKLEGGDMLKTLGLQLQQRGVELKEAEAKRLTPAEVQLKTTTEDTLSGLDSALQDLTRAYQLNPNTFGNTMIERAQRKALQETGVKDERLSNTTEVENLLGQQILSKLKATFGSAPTEGERAILMELEGAGAKTPEDRAKIIQRAYKAAKERRAREEKRLNEIKSGLYRSTDTAPSNLE